MIRLKISTKILLYFALVSLIPLGVATFILVSSAHTQLLQAASTKQQAVANDLADRVNSYLGSKINNLVNISQLYSTGNLPQSEIGQNLAVALNDNPDMQRVAIVNASGQDQVVFKRSGQVSTLENESNTDAFKAVNFLSGKAYVSSVSYNSSHEPIITIATPVLTSNFSSHLSDLNNANFGIYSSSGDIQGAVIASYNMSNLWNSVLSTKVGQGGYAYVVDGLGNLVAHPNNQFLATHPKLSNVEAVKDFINGQITTGQTVSETGKKVISTPRVIPVSAWAIIVEEPVSSVYSGVNSYIQLATIIGLSAIAFSIALSFFFRRQLTEPIKKLAEGARRFGRGEFDKQIELKSDDELSDLAETFNKMGKSINELVGDLKTNNLSLLVEQTKLNNIISSVSDAVIALNNKGEIVSANPPAAKLISKTAKEIQSQKMTDLYRFKFDDKPFSPTLDKPGNYHYTDLTLHNGNEIFYLDLAVSVLSHKDSDVAVIITIRDLTKSRELDFMKLDFVAIAAHELRTPLTVVRGYLDLLNTEAIRKFTLNNLENLQKAVEGTDQLRDLINKLLNIARIERGEMEIFIEKMNLTKLVKDSVRQHNPQSIQKEQRLTFKAASDKTIYVPADPSSITEVLNNLIGNAIKYTGKRGIITVELEANEIQAMVKVSDSGPGIPESLRDKLFTKFYRAERSLISGSRGTGLGLFISKTIIELQHGEIGLDSSDTNGSTFFFTLPIYDPEKYDKLIPKEKQLGGIHGWFKKRNDRRR